MDLKKFYTEYWDGDDDGTYIESAGFYAEDIIEATRYAESKYGSVILIKETTDGLCVAEYRKKLVESLALFILNERNLSIPKPFLTEFEDGVRSGKNDILDDIEEIIKKNYLQK